jgi:hypothetical protein
MSPNLKSRRLKELPASQYIYSINLRDYLALFAPRSRTFSVVLEGLGELPHFFFLIWGQGLRDQSGAGA